MNSLLFKPSILTTQDIFNNMFPDTITPKENNGVYSLKFKLPGFNKEDIKISFEAKENSRANRIVTISASNAEFGTEKFQSFVHNNIDDKSTKATLKNGILTITYSLEKIKNPLSSLKIEVE